MAGFFEPGRLVPGSVYRVVRHLAQGGMGVLYEVEDTTIGRRYALKTLHPDMVDREDLVRRMQDEARSLGKLQHPNIVQVITAGVTGEGNLPFYVMELLEGQSLRGVLDARRGTDARGLGVARALRIGGDLLAALQLAHDNALVHRDVKPENIFLARTPDGTRTKLLDFGIVRMLNRHATITRNQFIGTMKYSSPEQITGLHKIGPASDIYSLGCVIYEMICGRGPFDDAGDAFKIATAHAQTTPPPLTAFAEVPPAVNALILHALAKNPTERPASCSAMATDLKKALLALEPSPGSVTDVDLLAVGDGAATTSPAGDRTLPVGDRTVTSAPVSATLAAPPPIIAPAGIDRNAPTRISPPSVHASPVPVNDTHVTAPPLAPRMTTVKMADAPVWKPQAYISTVQTRKKADPTPLIALLVAMFVAAAMVTGAVIFVRHARAGAVPAAVVPPK